MHILITENQSTTINRRHTIFNLENPTREKPRVVETNRKKKHYIKEDYKITHITFDPIGTQPKGP